MVAIAALLCALALVLLTPEPALAWGPVTHIALGVQALATVITPDQPLQAALLAIPEVFLYGSLAPDIVQGRRLQSRFRRHSHNWETGFDLLGAAQNDEQRVFALGYLAHLAADVVAHNFFLPARFIGRFSSGIASHIYSEARFDALYDNDYRELLLTLVGVDFGALDRMLERAIDAPLLSFSAHRAIFDGGLRRIRQWQSLINALGGPPQVERLDADLFYLASCGAIAGILRHREEGAACRFDPMGEAALKNTRAARRNLQRLTRLGPKARRTAHELAGSMVADLRTHLAQTPLAARRG